MVKEMQPFVIPFFLSFFSFFLSFYFKQDHNYTIVIRTQITIIQKCKAETFRKREKQI